jgi:uncharacterized protein
LSYLVLFLCSLGLLAGSTVKGVVGIGLPLVAVPLLTALVDLKTAVTLTVVPIIASNFQQSFHGGHFNRMLRRFWTLLVPLFVSIMIGTRLLVVLPEKTLDLIIGLSIIAMPIVLRLRPNVRVKRDHERWLNPLVGVASGLLGGISTFYGPPLMLYVFSMRMPKDEFIPAISIMYTVAGVGMLIGLGVMGVSTPTQLGFSVLMLIPTGIGMWLGRYVRVQLSESRFEFVLICVYVATGLSFLVHAVL